MLIYALLFACSGDPSDGAADGPPADTDADADADTDTDTDTDTGDSGEFIVGNAPLQFRGKVPKSVLMISIDTMRKDHLTRYGGAGETDWMDGMMDDGVVMDDHLTCSNWTFPGTSCTILGRYHEDNRHIPQFSTTYRAPFPDDLPFLAGAIPVRRRTRSTGRSSGLYDRREEPSCRAWLHLILCRHGPPHCTHRRRARGLSRPDIGSIRGDGERLNARGVCCLRASPP